MTERQRYLEGKNYSAWRVTDADFQGIPDLIKWAVLAPNSHNTQPWVFSVDGNTIEISPDLERSLQVSDPTQREMYVSIGAAIANLKVAAHHFGYNTYEQVTKNIEFGTTSKRISLTEGYIPTNEDHVLFDAITKRVSNRNAHQDREIPQAMKDAIATLAEKPDIHAILIEDRERKERIGLLVYAGDRIILSDPGFTGELSSWARPNTTKEFDGMPGFGFGISDFQSRLFPSLVRSGVLSSEAAEEDRKRLSEKTAGIGIISIKDENPESWMNAGEAFEKAALKATSMGLSVNVLAVLVETRDFHKDLQKIASTEHRPAIMFRLGYAEQPTPHAPRRPAKDVMPVGFGEERSVIPKDKPKIFTLKEGAYELEDLQQELGDVDVIDVYGQEYLSELYFLRNPQIDFRTPQGQAALEALVSARDNDYDGVWVYFPWKKQLSHMLKEEEFYEVLYSRNDPCIEKNVQERLGTLRVGVTGLSVGRDIALLAAATGVRHLKIADFDSIALSNTPRMGSVSALEIGENKTISLARELYEFNPYIHVNQYTAGVHDGNVGEFMDDLDIMIDHMDNIPLKLTIRERGREKGIPVFMATDIFLTPIFDRELPSDREFFGGRATSETLERLRQLPKNFAEWAKMAVEVFGLENTPAPVLRNFMMVNKGEQNYGSQLALTGYAAAAQMAYFLYEAARGNLERLAPFKALHIEQPDLFDPNEDEQARKEFKKI